MVSKLYILGPAFDKPSIDPQCNVAVSLMRLWSRETHKDWELICATKDFERLPCLEDDTGRYVGLQNILSHIRNDLTAKFSAEDEALAAFIKSRGQRLIDVYHYVCYVNYAEKTRSAFSQFLPWSANYIIPPKRRESARKRTARLNISSIDIDDVHESVLDQDASGRNESIPKTFDRNLDQQTRSIFTRRQPVQSLLLQTGNANAFKLRNLSEGFYAPLAELLGERLYFGPDVGPGIIDCFVYGYMSLLDIPNMPQPFATNILHSQYDTLSKYLERMTTNLKLNCPTDSLNLLFGNRRMNSLERDRDSLPWLSIESVTIGQNVMNCTTALLQSFPFLPKLQPVVMEKTPFILVDYLPQVIASVAATLGLTGYLLFRSSFWPRGNAIQIFNGISTIYSRPILQAPTILDALSFKS